MDDKIQQLQVDLGNTPFDFELRRALAERYRDCGEWMKANEIMLESKYVRIPKSTESVNGPNLRTSELPAYRVQIAESYWIGFEHHGYAPFESTIDCARHLPHHALGEQAITRMYQEMRLLLQIGTFINKEFQVDARQHFNHPESPTFILEWSVPGKEKPLAKFGNLATYLTNHIHLPETI